MSIFFELHKDIPREGPGNRASTRRALDMLSLPPNPRILDVGCGPGDQTLELAKHDSAQIVAVDLHLAFLDELKRRAKIEGVDHKIETVQASMMEMKFPEHSFDVIWSEGAIYIMGFEKGLVAWKPFLKSGGYLVVSELSWLTKTSTEEATTFWGRNYPGMKHVTENEACLNLAGYQSVGTFVLPEEGWWDMYYRPLEARVAELRIRYQHDAEALAVLDETEHEIDLYRKYSNEYGYVFYLMQLV